MDKDDFFSQQVKRQIKDGTYDPGNKNERPKLFKNHEPSTYPTNQTKRLGNWEIMMKTAKNSKTKDNRIQAKEIRKTIYKD